jgi:repressor LexA
MITKKQKAVLDFVTAYTKKQHYAPSNEEIRSHFSLASVSTAHHYLKKLEEGGYLTKEANQPRGIALQAFDFSMSLSGSLSGFEFISVPLVGAANCGPAELLAEENIEGYLTVKRDVVPRVSGIFALRASGNSLNRAQIKGKNIEHGDYVLIDAEDRNISDGDYVLSIINGAANLKKYTFDKKKNLIALLSESTEEFKPILIMAGDDFAINGKIVGVIKRG